MFSIIYLLNVWNADARLFQIIITEIQRVRLIGLDTDSASDAVDHQLAQIFQIKSVI